MTIDKIILHHSGGLGTNNRASTKHLTWKDIDDYHKSRWDFKSSMGHFSGYHFIYDPKDKTLKQTRAIGEEAAHTIGQNTSSIGICVVGNYLVDDLDLHTKNDIMNLLIDLCRGHYRDFVIAPNTTITLTPYRIFGHSYFSKTECPGIDVNWFKNQVKVRVYPKPSLQELKTALDFVLQLAQKLKVQLQTMRLGNKGRECDS